MTEQLRATKTEQYLLEALIELTKEKDIHRVQVRELCEKAQVNRTTFYKHYEDMPDFLQHITQNFMTRMDIYLQTHLDQENMFIGILSGNSEVFCHWCVEFMLENIEVMRMMLGPHGSIAFQQNITGLLARNLKDAIAQEMPRLHENNSIDFLVNYVVGAMWAILRYEVFLNTKYTADYLAKQMSFLLYDCTLKPLMESQIMDQGKKLCAGNK